MQMMSSRTPPPITQQLMQLLQLLQLVPLLLIITTLLFESTPFISSLQVYFTMEDLYRRHAIFTLGLFSYIYADTANKKHCPSIEQEHDNLLMLNKN